MSSSRLCTGAESQKILRSLECAYRLEALVMGRHLRTASGMKTVALGYLFSYLRPCSSLDVSAEKLLKYQRGGSEAPRVHTLVLGSEPEYSDVAIV